MAGLDSLTMQQAVDVYVELLPDLPAMDVQKDDIRRFVHETVDLNMDGTLSRLEMLVGLVRLVRPRDWRDAHAELLWSMQPRAA